MAGLKPTGFFPGSTIGNFEPYQAAGFLRHAGRMLGSGAVLLIGIDLIKNPAILNAAYDDAAGVTAKFNLNLLARINRELGADFDLDAFEHVAFYDREQEWIEMRLRALRPQVVEIHRLGITVHFANREELRTEISAKFTRERLAGDLGAAGLDLEALYTDRDDLFAVTLATRRD